MGTRAVLQAAVILVVVQRFSLWPVAILGVIAVELWQLRPNGRARRTGRTAYLLEKMPAVLMGLSVVMIIAAAPRLVSQVAAAALYAAWRMWWRPRTTEGGHALASLLLVQVALFEAVFLMAAVWRTPSWIVLICAWLGAYLSVYAALSRRGDRSAGVMAAAWGVIVVEVSWVLLAWLFVYTMGGGYLLVPQPALILTAMAYCFGSIYISQREGSLSRGRLAEYLVIGLILIAIVVVGTSWHGNI